MTPDCAEFLLQTPEAERVGRVFAIVGLDTGRPISGKRVSRIVSKIGEQAGVVVNKAEGKYASARRLPPDVRDPLGEAGHAGCAPKADASLQH